MTSTPTKQEIVEQGKRIYAERLQRSAEQDHLGRFLVVDTKSGDFEIGDNDTEATLGILRRRPDALLYGVRIGDTVAYRFGHGKIGVKR